MIDELVDALADVVDQSLISAAVPGLVVGVQVGEESRYLARGSTVLGGGSPVTDRTLFRWCSLTKLATAEVVLQLCEEQPGLLDARLTESLPGPAGSAFADVTTRMLLAHTSGIEGEWAVSLDEFGTDARALSRFIAASGQLRRFAQPGAAFGYCNPGFWLLAAIVERLTVAPFERALRDRVLDPLALGDTRVETEFDWSRGGESADVALPHVRADGKVVPLTPTTMPRARIASGGLTGSARDVLRFGSAMLQHPTRLEEAGRSRVPRGTPGGLQGLGWAVDACEDGRSFGHSGFYEGFASQLQVYPEQQAIIAVLGNSDTTWGVREEVLRAADRLLIGAPAAVPDEPFLADAEYTGSFGYPGMREVTLRVDEDGADLTLVPVDAAPSTVRAVATAAGRYEIAEGALSGAPLTLLDGGEGYRSFRLGPRLGGRAR